jgi:hypothetical protein
VQGSGLGYQVPSSCFQGLLVMLNGLQLTVKGCRVQVRKIGSKGWVLGFTIPLKMKDSLFWVLSSGHLVKGVRFRGQGQGQGQGQGFGFHTIGLWVQG